MENERSKIGNVLYIFLAVAIAVVIWFFVDEFGNNGDPYSAKQEVTEIPIEYIGVNSLADKGLMLLDEETSKTVDLTFEGARRLVTGLDRNKIRVTANLSNITSPGVQTVDYSYTYVDTQRRGVNVSQKYAGVSVSNSSISRATVNISELYSKEVDVRCELVGTIAEGYSAGQPKLSQETIEIQGMEDVIKPVSYAKVTLDLGDGANESVSAMLPCQFYDDQGHLVDSETIYPSAEQIQVTLPVYVTKELQLRVDLTEAPGVRARNTEVHIEPEYITVSGEASKLRNVDSITLDDLNLLDLVSAENTTYHTYSITVPEGCENLSGISRATVTLSFKDLVSARVTSDHIVIGTELPEGKAADILTESLRISIFGTSEAVGAVSGNDILITPDLSDYVAASGVYTVAADVSIQARGDIGIMGDYQVQVRIREQTAQETAEEPEAGTSESGETAPSQETTDNSETTADAPNGG